MSSETSQRWRAERAMERSREAKQRNREFDRQTELEKVDRISKGQMDVQRLSNQGYMDVTKLKEEGDWGRHKSDIDWRTGDAARNFTQRENQFERAFQQTQSIADRTADQWTRQFDESVNQYNKNRFDKGVADRMAGNVNPVTGEANPNAVSYDQAAQDTSWGQSFYGKSPDEIKAMQQQAGVQSFLKKWDTLDAMAKKKEYAALSPDFLQALRATGNFPYGQSSQSSVETPESISEKTKTREYRRPFSDAVQPGSGGAGGRAMGGTIEESNAAYDWITSSGRRGEAYPLRNR